MEVMEQVLLQLLVPNSDAIKQATVEIKRLMKEPDIIATLCRLMASTQHAQVRQYSAVLLRRQVLLRSQWKSVSPEVARDIRANLLRVMFEEKNKLAQRAMVQLVATIAKHDLPQEHWPELLQFINNATGSVDQHTKAVGMSVIAAVASTSHKYLNKQLPSILRVCSTTLVDRSNHIIPYYSLVALKNLVPSAGNQSLKPWQSLVPKSVEAVKIISAADEELAVEGMELFDELLETEVPVLQPHVGAFLQFCLETAQGNELKLAVKALSLVAAVVRQKKKVVLKMNLIVPIISVAFPIMCRGTDENSCEEMDESQTPEALASQVIDTMALHLPSEKVVSSLMKFITPALSDSNPNHRRAAFIALAVAAEGCADHLKTKHLDKLLPAVYNGMSDESAEVRNASMFTLGQFSEHLQPNIAKHSATLLPLLFSCLQKTSDNTAQVSKKDITRTYYAVEMFCENMGKDIVPYLNELITFLLHAIDTSALGEVKELAISAISSIASSAKGDLMPFFPRIQTSLERFLYPTDDEEQLKIQLQAVEALGVLAQTLGEQFRPLTEGCMKLGLGLLEKATDLDLKRCIYGLFAAVSNILKLDMAPYMEMIVPYLIERVVSVEGVTAHFDDQDKDFLKLFDGDDDRKEQGENGVDISANDDDAEGDDASDDEDDVMDHVRSVDIQTPFLDEKEDAVVALGTIAKNTGRLFLPYMEKSFGESVELLDYPVADIRKAAASTVSQLCCAVGLLAVDDKSFQAGLSSMLSTTVPKFIELVREDEDREVVMTVLESLNEMLSALKTTVLEHTGAQSGTAPAVVLLNMIREVFQHKIKCQMGEDAEDLDDDEAEIDKMLIENAGDILPALAKILGGDVFSPYFATVVPELMKKLRKTSTVAEKSFAIGVFAETMDKMGAAAAAFFGRLHPVFVAAISDEDEEVRNNAVYGLGVLAANGGVEAAAQYQQILALLSRTLSTESDERVRDNICAAVARMAVANPSAVPAVELFPAVTDRLPLKTDVEENVTAFRYVGFMCANSQHADVVCRLPRLLAVIGELLSNEELSAEGRKTLADVATSMIQSRPELLAAAAETASEAVMVNLRTSFGTC